MLSISFQSHLIRHSGSGCTFKDTQRVLEHLRHSENTRPLGHLESTRRALRHLGHSGHSDIQALGHSCNWALTALGTRALGHPRHSIQQTQTKCISNKKYLLVLSSLEMQRRVMQTKVYYKFLLQKNCSQFIKSSSCKYFFSGVNVIGGPCFHVYFLRHYF